MGNTNSVPNETYGNENSDSTTVQPKTVNKTKDMKQNPTNMSSQCSAQLDERSVILNKSSVHTSQIISFENDLYVCTLCNSSKFSMKEMLNHCATPQHKSNLKERFCTKKNPAFEVSKIKQVHLKDKVKQNLSHELPNPNDLDLSCNDIARAVNLSWHSNNNFRETETDLNVTNGNNNIKKNTIKPIGLKNLYKSEGAPRKNMQNVTQRKKVGQINSGQAPIQNNLNKRSLIHENPKKNSNEFLGDFKILSEECRTEINSREYFDENISEISNVMSSYFWVPNKKESDSALNCPAISPKEKQTKLPNTVCKKPFGKCQEKSGEKEKYHVSDGNFGDIKKFEDRKAYQKANSTKSSTSSSLNKMENLPSTSHPLNRNEQQSLHIPQANRNRKKKANQGFPDSNQKQDSQATYIEDLEKLRNFQDLSQVIPRLQKSVTLNQTGNKTSATTDTNFISFTSNNNVICTLCDINIPKAKNFTSLLSNITAHVEGMTHINKKKTLRKTLEKTIQALN